MCSGTMWNPALNQICLEYSREGTKWQCECTLGRNFEGKTQADVVLMIL